MSLRCRRLIYLAGRLGSMGDSVNHLGISLSLSLTLYLSSDLSIETEIPRIQVYGTPPIFLLSLDLGFIVFHGAAI